jgi:hypothetical protein
MHTFAFETKPQYLGFNQESAESHWPRFFVVVSTLVVVNYPLTGCQDPVSLIFAPIGLGSWTGQWGLSFVATSHKTVTTLSYIQ